MSRYRLLVDGVALFQHHCLRSTLYYAGHRATLQPRLPMLIQHLKDGEWLPLYGNDDTLKESRLVYNAGWMEKPMKMFVVTVKEVNLVTYVVEAESADAIITGDLLEYVNSDSSSIGCETIEPIELVGKIEEYQQ